MYKNLFFIAYYFICLDLHHIVSAVSACPAGQVDNDSPPVYVGYTQYTTLSSGYTIRLCPQYMFICDFTYYYSSTICQCDYNLYDAGLNCDHVEYIVFYCCDGQGNKYYQYPNTATVPNPASTNWHWFTSTPSSPWTSYGGGACGVVLGANQMGMTGWTIFSCPSGQIMTGIAFDIDSVRNDIFGGIPACNSLCKSCPAGYYCTGGSAQAICPVGTYCIGGGSNSIPCTSGSYTSVTGQSKCTLCAQGSYGGASSLSVCSLCIPGTYASGSGLSTCIKCNPGTFANGSGFSTCQLCTAGTFGSISALSICSLCNKGTYTMNTGLSVCTSCIAGSYGTGSGYSVCLQCSTGTYASSSGLSLCMRCIPGTYAIGPAASSCSNCGLGTYQTGTAANLCVNCGLGSYGPQLASTNCLPCAPGSNSLSSGSSVCNSCPTKPLNSNFTTFCNWRCNTGYFANSSVCQAWRVCPNGTLVVLGNWSNDTTCVPCTPISNSFFNAYNSCSFVCNMGYMLASATVCQCCAQGTYRPNTTITSCVSCPSGTYANSPCSVTCLTPPLYSVVNPQATNYWCIAGYYLQSNMQNPLLSACVVCSAGYYSSGLGMVDACPYCQAGTYSTQSQATICTACTPGTYFDLIGSSTGCKAWSTCAYGSYQSGGTTTRDAGCISCVLPASSIYVYSITNSCTFNCGYGYQPSGSTCLQCAAGTYKTLVSNDLCIACSKGSYSTTLGMVTTQCITCAVGKVSGRGATYCYASGSQTAYLQPGISQTCQWLYFNNYGCACWNSLSMIWNENNGPSPSSSTCTVAGGGSCNLAQQVATSGNCAGYSVTYYVGVPTSLSVRLFGYQPTACSQCYQSVASAVQIPSNCASSLAPTAQVCYIYNQCSGCGCFKSVGGSTAVCHSCNAGYYSQVPYFTACTACASGTYSTGQGILDTVEWASSTFTYSSVQTTVADCQLPRLDAEGGWCPLTSNNEWIQIDLGSPQNVKGIVTQGRATALEWTTSVNLAYSNDAVNWVSGSYVLATNNADSYTRQVTFLSPSFFARYLRLVPLAYNSWPSLRWNALVQTTVCATCVPGTYSTSISSSVCTSCQPAPSNGFYVSNCTYHCNAGYYVVQGAGCALCSDSSLCSAGQYRPQCTNGVTNDQTCNGQCSNMPQSPQAFYSGPSTDNTGNSCPWGCNVGFFKDASVQSCTICQPCNNIGFYVSFACTAPSLIAVTSGPPVCLACNAIANAIFTASGQGGNASSCPFQCNSGYFLKSGSCMAWTVTCPTLGYNWSAGTLVADATCTPCPFYGQPAIYVYSVQNSCSFSCGQGYQLLQNATCAMCPAGKYKNTTTLVSCSQCPTNYYQNSPGLPACIVVPPNAQATADSTNIMCNAGYVYTTNSMFQSSPFSCQSCLTVPLNNTRIVQWNGCTVVALACNTGYYRNWTSGPSCIQCPVTTPMYSSSGILNLSAVCSTCTSTNAVQDEINSCSFQCNAGYYAQSYACIRCNTVACSGGLYAQMCTSGSTSDSCMNCSYQLNSYQSWVTGCQWQCNPGYTLSGSGCTLCSVGTYKVAYGNQSCTVCPAGFYAPTQILCSPCVSGFYNPQPLAAVCQTCPKGTFGAFSNATSCANCTSVSTWPNSFTSMTTSTSCSICPWATPVSKDGMNCIQPIPPCPAGFYPPLYLTYCVLCPSGTYCPVGQSPMFCPQSTTSSQPAIAVANCTPYVLQQSCTANTGKPSSDYSVCVPNAGYFGLSPPQICPYDMYCPAASLVPLACPQGTTAPQGSSALQNCTTYMALPCRPGYYQANASATFCLPCPQGCYCPGSLVIYACEPTFNYSSPTLATMQSQCVHPSSNSTAVIQCPLNTMATNPVSTLQCRANAGYYYLPGSTSATLCPANYFCPQGALIPQPCPSAITSCPQMGQYPTPLLCPFSGTAAPANACQTCTGLPLYASWSSNTDPACPFCCNANYFQNSVGGCNLQQDSSVCPAGQYMPNTPVCAISVQSCALCPPLQQSNTSFLNATFRNSFFAVVGYGWNSNACAVGCAAGFYYAAASGLCLGCSPGYYKSWVGNDTFCLPCAEGYFASSIGLSSCAQCPALSIGYVNGTGCQCLSGLFLQAMTNGSIACVPCPSGSISSASACTQCVPGTLWQRWTK